MHNIDFPGFMYFYHKVACLTMSAVLLQAADMNFLFSTWADIFHFLLVFFLPIQTLNKRKHYTTL